MITFLTTLLELFVGLIAVNNFRTQTKNRMSEKDWLEEVEKKEQEIAKLKLEVKIWKKHYETVTSKGH